MGWRTPRRSVLVYACSNRVEHSAHPVAWARNNGWTLARLVAASGLSAKSNKPPFQFWECEANEQHQSLATVAENSSSRTTAHNDIAAFNAGTLLTRSERS